MVIEEDRPLLDARLRFWPGPLHFDPLTKPEELLALCYAVGATHLVVDSLKDLAIGLNKDDVAGQVNRLFQFLTAGGIQLVVIHHQRKEQADNKKPTKLADVYGNQQIVNGAGSVIILWGEAGDGTIELDHLKQPASPVGPFNIVHNHAIGFTEVESSPGDALTILRGATNGLVADGIARYMFGTEKPSRAQVERARRRAENLVMKQLAHTTQEESSIRGGRPIVRYFATDTRHGEG
jgi:replicative DNA helicase